MRLEALLRHLGAWILPQDRTVKARAIPLRTLKVATDEKTHEAKQRNER